MTRSEALKYRNHIEKAAQSLPVEDALEVPTLYPKWAPDVICEVDKRYYYNNVLYSCLQTHTTQANWTPDTTPSLFAKVLIPDTNATPEWEQPDSTNPYMTGDKVTHNGFTWVSDVDNNVWEPGVYGWTQVTT